MNTLTLTNAHQVGDVITVDLSRTVGQDSAIEANGSPFFTIRVTTPVVVLPPTTAGEPQSVPGFGKPVAGPVARYDVVYTLDSVVD